MRQRQGRTASRSHRPGYASRSPVRSRSCASIAASRAASIHAAILSLRSLATSLQRLMRSSRTRNVNSWSRPVAQQQPAVDPLFVLCALFLFARRSAALELRGMHRGLHLRELRIELLGRQLVLGVISHWIFPRPSELVLRRLMPNHARPLVERPAPALRRVEGGWTVGC